MTPWTCAEGCFTPTDPAMKKTCLILTRMSWAALSLIEKFPVMCPISPPRSPIIVASEDFGLLAKISKHPKILDREVMWWTWSPRSHALSQKTPVCICMLWQYHKHASPLGLGSYRPWLTPSIPVLPQIKPLQHTKKTHKPNKQMPWAALQTWKNYLLFLIVSGRHANNVAMSSTPKKREKKACFFFSSSSWMQSNNQWR